MRFTVAPSTRDHQLDWYWILRDEVTVIVKQAGFTDKREAIEGARDFKQRLGAAEIDCEEQPWHQEVLDRGR